MNVWIFNSLYALAHQNASFDAIIVYLSGSFGYLLIFGMAVQILSASDTKAIFKKAFVAVSTGAAAWLIANGIKDTIFTPRPFLVLDHVVPLFPMSMWSSALPSGHASFFGGLAISLLFTKFPHRNIYAVAALIIGISRIIAGVHWPIDILNGFLIGFVSAWILSKIAKRYFNT